VCQKENMTLDDLDDLDEGFRRALDFERNGGCFANPVLCCPDDDTFGTFLFVGCIVRCFCFYAGAFEGASAKSQGTSLDFIAWLRAFCP